MKTLRNLILIALVFFTITVASPSRAENLVIIGWDGAGMNDLKQLLAQNQLPNLAKFLQTGGGHLVPLELIAKTNTMASWSQAFTGLTYDQTGVLGNYYFRGIVNTTYNNNTHTFGMDFWIRPIPYEQTIIQPIQNLGHKIGWFVSKGFLWTGTQTSALANIALTANDSLMQDPIINGENYINTLGQQAIAFIQSNSDFLVFLHLNPDEYGHLYGENSQRYAQEFVRADTLLGQILQVVSSNTKVIVMADHGFDPGSRVHENAPDAWMATNLPVHYLYYQQKNQRAFGTMRDVAPTILDYYGIDYKTRVPQIRGKSLLQKGIAPVASMMLLMKD
jgi:predicted AlkP superfamily phosphohydrolase/phosphomutase